MGRSAAENRPQIAQGRPLGPWCEAGWKQPAPARGPAAFARPSMNLRYEAGDRWTFVRPAASSGLGWRPRSVHGRAESGSAAEPPHYAANLRTFEESLRAATSRAVAPRMPWTARCLVSRSASEGPTTSFGCENQSGPLGLRRLEEETLRHTKVGNHVARACETSHARRTRGAVSGGSCGSSSPQ